MKWVTWEHIGVDRMGCAWLIVRHIDREAEFAFVPEGTTDLPEGYEGFDIPGVRLTHRRGHSTFHTMLSEYDLTDPVLKRIASIIDEADVVQEVMVEPAAAGLDILCRGLRRISSDDHAAVQQGLMLYDGLYAELSANQSAGK